MKRWVTYWRRVLCARLGHPMAAFADHIGDEASRLQMLAAQLRLEIRDSR